MNSISPTTALVLAPVHSLKSDFDIINNHVLLPDPTSDSYTHSTHRVVGHKRFNATQNDSPAIDTYELSISGVSLVFEENSALHPLYQAWNNRSDLETVNLYADEIIIRSKLCLPSSHVNIYARSLVFEDEGCIDTTPLLYNLPSTAPIAEDGHHAGDIALYIHKLTAPDAHKRLIANGGNGQEAMAGKPGANGVSIPKHLHWDGTFNRPMWWFDPELKLDWSKHMWALEGYTAIHAEIIKTMGMSSGWSGGERGHAIEKHEMTEKVDTIGTADTWPEDGKDPKVKPGKPGEPGNGGTLLLPSKWAQDDSCYTLNGGKAGQKAADIAPSAAGEPIHSCHVKAFFKPSGGVQTTVDRLEVTARHVSKNGAPAIAPSAKNKKGKQGTIIPLADDHAGYWLHPRATSAFVEYAKDMYLAERPDLVLSQLQEYQAALGDLPASDESTISLNVHHAEITAMIRQMQGMFDYFGNPAGWAPMLSFESNLKLYQNEIDASARQLFLSYWIEKNQTRTDALVHGINFTLSQLNIESQAALADYHAAVKALETTEIEYNNLINEIESLLLALGNKEAELQRKAKKELQLEHIIRGSAKLLGGVLQMIPVGQPALGAVGSVVSVLGDFDPDKPFDTATSLASEVWGTNLVQKKIMPAVKSSAKSFLNITTEEKTDLSDFDKAKAKKELEEAVKKSMAEEKAVKEQVASALGSFTVPEDELNEALQRAISDCPEYQEIAQEIAALGDKKSNLSQSIQSSMHVLDTATNTILNNALGRIALREQLANQVESLNHEARRFANEMGRRARARLIRYQYYMVKSYNYSMLTPREDVDYRAAYMLKEFTKLLGDSKDGSLTQQQYESIKGVFEAQLNDIISEVIDTLTLNVRPPNLTISVSLSPRQVARLNRDGQLDINLMEMGYLFPTDDDVRIVNIKTTAVDLIDIPKGKAVNVRLEYRHSGISTLRKYGRQFMFRTGDYRLPSGNKLQPDDSYRNNKMLWGTNIKVDLHGNQEPEPIVPSPTTQSLLHHLLQSRKGDGETGAALEYYRPSVWADISIRKTATPEPFKGEIKNLNLEVTYDYLTTPDHIYSVYIATPGGVMPIISSDTVDMNHRNDGRGNFLRTYDSQQVSSVVFTAPETFGSHTFMGWKILADVVPPNPDGSLPLTPLMTPGGVETFLSISERFSAEENDNYALNNLWMQGLIKSRTLSLTIDRHYSVLAIYLPLAS